MQKEPTVLADSLKFGGGKRDRTADLLHAMQALYQLSYTPKFGGESGTRTPDTRIMIPLLYPAELIRRSFRKRHYTAFLNSVKPNNNIFLLQPDLYR